MPPFDQKIHHRRSIRLAGYDYSQAGAYFVTIVTYRREHLFGEVVDGQMVLNDLGKIVQKWWDDLPSHFPGVETGAFIIMPNHVHGIIIIIDTTRRGAVPAPRPTPNDDVSTETPGAQDPGRAAPGRGKPAPTDDGIWSTRKPTLGQIVAYFKYQSTKEINSLDAPNIIAKLWQRNYYEHIIRNEREMDAIWNYIESNPSNWADDAENRPLVK